MRIAIVDDEPSLLRLAGHTLSDYGKVKSLSIEIDEFTSGEDFLENFKPGLYSVIFMDVYMTGITGVDTVQKLRETDSSVPVIFLTTSSDHMKPALNCHAFDYLIKPAARADFFKVMDDCIKMLGHTAVHPAKYIEFISNRITIKLPVDNIVSIVSNGHIVIITAKDGTKYPAKDTFSSISESVADSTNLLVINRGIMINMDYIEKITDGMCVMNTGTEYPVKIRGLKQVIQTYEDYKLTKL